MPGACVKNVRAYYRSGSQPHLIAEIGTKEGERVFMTRYDGDLADDPTAALISARQLSQGKAGSAAERLVGVVFPKVALSRQSELPLGETCAISKDGIEFGIEQFVLEQRFEMDELGASARAGGAAMAVPRGMVPRMLIIDGDFLVWFETPEGVIRFAGLITPADMKDPRD
ncbi:MAG: hypothetical protein HY549_10190 [Elusimicrobia bacterium]|nr:hypothetical protein [Elusimicrobiota bacterium]